MWRFQLKKVACVSDGFHSLMRDLGAVCPPFLIAQSVRGKILVLVESATVLACFPPHDDVMNEG